METKEEKTGIEFPSMTDTSPVLEISTRPLIAQTNQIESEKKTTIKTPILLAGILFIWLTYGAVSVAGSVLQKEDDVSVIITLFWLCCSRLTGNIIPLGVLFWKETDKAHLKLNQTSLITVILPMISLIGWFSYFKLVKYGDISLINPFINLYVIIPIVVSTIVNKQRFTKNKIIGSGIGIIAGCILGALSGNSTTTLSWWEQTIYFVLVFVFWSIVDTVSAIFGAGSLNLFSILVFNSIGYLICSLVFSIMIVTTNTVYVFTSDWITFWMTNICLPLGWLTYIYLCKYSASIVTPLFSLNYIIPVVYGLIFNHESVGFFKIIALILSICAILFIGKAIDETNKTKNILPVTNQELISFKQIFSSLFLRISKK